MLLPELERFWPRTFRYVERYVNDGSPSGFSEQYSTTPETSPFGNRPYFNLWAVRGEAFRDFGHSPGWLVQEIGSDCTSIFIHPDMVPVLIANGVSRRDLAETKVLVSPTASGRTVQVLAKDSNDYVKLHYAGILGRIRRELPFKKAVSGPEVSLLIEKAISDDELPSAFHIFPEIYTRTLQLADDLGEWSMVLRKGRPLGKHADSISIIIPGFGLFSADRFAVHHPPLIKQVVEAVGCNSGEYILQRIVGPLVACYFDLILRHGLQLELNSQNVLFGFSKNYDHVSVIFRDMESVDKDITIRRQLGLPIDFLSFPYKCIASENYNYQIKHSFMFDFKLGECLLRPLSEVAENYCNLPKSKFVNFVRDVVATYTPRLPSDFFPRNRWYSFDRVLVDQSKDERPYVEHSNPVFRLE